MKTERVVIQIVCFRDDDDGAQDLDAVWKNLQDALYQIWGVERVEIVERIVASEGPGPKAPP